MCITVALTPAAISFVYVVFTPFFFFFFFFFLLFLVFDIITTMPKAIPMKRKMTRRENLKKMWQNRKLKAKLRARVASEAEASTLRREEREEEESTVNHESVCIASKKKLDMSVHLYESDEGDEISDRYMFVHEVKLLEWARSIARCGCGKKMTVKEENVEGMVSTFAAVCKDCKIENKFCTSEGGRLKGGYDIHKKIVKSSLETGNGYVGVRGLFDAFNMHPFSEKGYYKIAKQIKDNGIEKMGKNTENCA